MGSGVYRLNYLSIVITDQLITLFDMFQKQKLCILCFATQKQTKKGKYQHQGISEKDRNPDIIAQSSSSCV